MSLIQIIAFLGITFFFLWMFEKIYSAYNLPKKLFQVLNIKQSFTANLIIIVILAFLMEVLVNASGNVFEIQSLQINLLRLFMLAFMFSFYSTKE